MEIVIAVIIIWLSWITIMAGVEINSLKSTVNKQQEQIDIIIVKHNDLNTICKAMNKVSIDIATKVVDIENRIDNKN